MNCYWCEKLPTPGGLKIRSITASAVCLSCGAAVCSSHSTRTGAKPTIQCEGCQSPASTKKTPKQFAETDVLN